MNSKAKIATGVLLIALIIGGFLVFTPYGRDLWGDEVSVATITMGFGFGGVSASEEPLSTQQVPTPGNQEADVRVEKVDKDKYQREMTDNGKPKLQQTEGKEQAQQQAAEVDVTITFELKVPPANKSVNFTFNAAQGQAAARKQFKSHIGPQELNGTTGTFYLNITIQISVEPPAGPSISFTLNPVTLKFEIPKEGEGNQQATLSQLIALFRGS